MIRRVALLSSAVLSLGACAQRQDPIAGAVAYPERSLTYAPLLAAAQAGLYTEPPTRLTLEQHAGGRNVAARVADGSALVGALSIADCAQSVSEGAPLLAIGALTRRLACQLVLAARSESGGAPDASLESLLRGEWRGRRIGVESGADGTEAFVRFFALRTGITPAPRDQDVLAGDFALGEPRWSALETSEALVAALADNRLDGFVGRSFAAAQTATLGVAQVAVNYGAGEGGASEVAEALPTVLVVHRDTANAAGETPAAKIVAALVKACARAATDLSRKDGVSIAIAALPERDALHLRLALQLAAPSPERSSYALDGRVSTEAVRGYLELSAMAGRPLVLKTGALTSNRFSG